MRKYDDKATRLVSRQRVLNQIQGDEGHHENFINPQGTLTKPDPTINFMELDTLPTLSPP